MYKNGLISKENLLSCIKNRFDGYSQQYQEDFCPLLKKQELTYIIHDNIKEYFLPEMDLINKNPKKFDSNRIKLCEENRNKIDDDIIKSLKKDDVDKLQSIISKIPKDLTKVKITDNIFDIINGNPSYINYSAGFGSIKCFKYLLLNQHEIDTDTLKFAIFGGNVEIIKIVDQNAPNEINYNKNARFVDKKEVLNDVFNMAIIKHRNDVFDWLLETKLANENNDKIFDSLVLIAAKNGNLHALIEIIDKGFNISSRFEQIVDLSSYNGFYKFAQVICNINTKDKEKLKLKRFHKQFYNNEDSYSSDDDDNNEDSFIVDDEKNNLYNSDGYIYNIIIPSVTFGNLSIFKLYNCQIISQDVYYDTILFCISKNYFSIVRYYFDYLAQIVKSSFNVKQINKIFSFSIKKENDDFFKYFIEKIDKKLFINVIDELIDEACRYNKFEIVKILFQISLSNNQKGKQKDFTSSFIHAITKNSSEICQFFLENKVLIDFNRSSFQKCDFSAIDEKMLSILNQYYPDEIKQILFTQDNLCSAIKNSNVFLIEYLLRSGVPSNIALIEAVKTNKVEIVDLILKFNNSPDFINQRSKDGTPLCVAVSNSNKIIVDRLLSLPGINPNYYDSNNDTPLIIAMKKLNIDIINSLLDFHGENINSQATQVNQALQILIHESKDIEILPILQRIIKIECADLNVRDGDKSIFSVALMLKSTKIVDFLLKSNKFDVNSYSPSNGDTPLIESIRSSNFQITKCLIEHPQTDINMSNYENETPLIVAVIKKNLAVVDLLINNEKFDPERSDLNYAFYISSSKIAKKLISIKSLNVEYINNTSNILTNTPLKLAVDKFDLISYYLLW